jgi:L-cysteine S-thiosulfotransferase
MPEPVSGGRPRARRKRHGGALALACAVLAGAAGAEPLLPYRVEGDAIPAPLAGARGDPERGRAIVLRRQSTCLLCHSGPFPETPFQGTIGPDLRGVGARLEEGQIRLRLVDPSRLNPATVMPGFYVVEGLTRVGAEWRGKPVLSAEEIEDVVAFLTTLREE